MKTLIIYDNTGMIWNITYGQCVLPEGLTATIMDVPEGSQIQSIDVSGEMPKIIYASLPENDIVVMKAEMNALRNENMMMSTALTFAAETFTDEQAIMVPNLYEFWRGAGIEYKEGKRVRFNDNLYKVISTHISQEDWTPENAPSLFAKILIENPNIIADWQQPDSTNGYMIGDKVNHNGFTYQSLIDNNVWEPGTAGAEGLWATL